MNQTEEINERNRQVIAEFREGAVRARGGGGAFSSPVLLLTTTGAKSGRRRTNPLRYLAENGRIFVCASFQGSANHPDWYHNLVANPRVTVEIGAETYEAEPRLITGAERDRLYAKQCEQALQFADYAKRTTRVIPVVELIRLRGGGV